jgi:hypothetical protein
MRLVELDTAGQVKLLGRELPGRAVQFLRREVNLGECADDFSPSNVPRELSVVRGEEHGSENTERVFVDVVERFLGRSGAAALDCWFCFY